jgi:hypothetical protein
MAAEQMADTPPFNQIKHMMLAYSVTVTATRQVVYAKDVQRITGKTERSARRLLARIRAAFQKPKDGLVSVQEFCLFTGLPLEVVQEALV